MSDLKAPLSDALAASVLSEEVAAYVALSRPGGFGTVVNISMAGLSSGSYRALKALLEASVEALMPGLLAAAAATLHDDAVIKRAAARTALNPSLPQNL